MKALFSSYPKQIKASTEHAENYYMLQYGVYAVQGNIPQPCEAAVMVTIEEGKVVICKGNPDELPPSVDRNAITPVYALGTNGPLAVPTGLVLVRFAEHIPAVSQREALQHIGYIIDQELDYVPQALWLKAANGEIAFALNNIPLLETQPDVENVEPQMLMESVRRGSNSHPL